jgi:hypothetical protein
VPPPLGAYHLLAFAVNGLGESTTGASTSLRRVKFTGISAGRGTGSGVTPSLALDTAVRKLLVATTDQSSLSTPALFQCDLDSLAPASCTYKDISAGQGGQSGNGPTALINTTGGKLLVVTRNSAGGILKPGLF